jgi:hypothetical protein
MKRILYLLAAAALLSQAALAFAQDSGEPSEESVLEAARSKYQQDQSASDEVPGGGTEAEVPYTPILLSFVPAISIPFGYYDVSIAGGAVGNLTRDVTGAEGAGVFNLARNVSGFQGAGVFNIVEGDVKGFQGAGVFNIVNGTVMGFQSAGVFNIAGKARTPFQGAGVFNIAEEIYGFQAAGVFNIAGRVAGGQVAGLFNSAERVSGVQIGVVNVARHIDGIQLGLINIAGNGVDSVGLSWEPASDFVYAHWQAGTPALYTVAGLGAPSGDWFRNIDGFVVSLGLGSRTRFLGLNLDLDISAEQAIGALPYGSFDCDGDWSAWEGWSMIRPYPAVRLAAGLPLGRHLQLVGGFKADFDFDSWSGRVPESLKVGSSWRGSLFDEDFTAWTKWFFGFKI